MQAKRHVEVTIILTEAEAKWLKGVLQNPLCGAAYEDEDERDQSTRKTLWDVLNKEGVE